MSLAPQVLLDGELVPAGQAKVSVLAEGFLFGRGVFETIRTQAGRALCLAAHHARLSASGSTLGLDAPPPLDELGLRITRLLAAVRMPAAAVKVVRYRELNRTAELITARTLPYSATDYLRGFRVQTLRRAEPDGRIAGHKTLNYLENFLARQSARAVGFDEALFVTPAGHVLEGSGSNLFVILAGHAYTPPLNTGILPGVTRAR